VTRDDFAKLVGETIAHCTTASHAPSIAALGLLPADDLMAAGGACSETLVLRADPSRFAIAGRPVRLNHQRPLRIGRAKGFLDGHTLESWSIQLDHRLFFWPRGHLSDRPFAVSLGAKIVVYQLASRAFFDHFGPDIRLSAINSGSASRKPAPRGDWLCVSAACAPAAFTHNRVRRGLVQRPDRVVEISIRQPVPPDLLFSLRSDP
jgi:hypothetical protein